MELKLSVSIGGTLQVKNAKGEWDWIKPEVGCEIKLVDGEVKTDGLQEAFADMWDNIVGPQFKTVVDDLLAEQLPEKEEAVDDEVADEKPNTDEDDYY